MNRLKCLLKLFKDVQILSALIWASTLLACAYFSDKNNIINVIITAAGFHVILMQHFAKNRQVADTK